MPTVYERLKIFAKEITPKQVGYISTLVIAHYNQLENPEPFVYTESSEGSFRVRNYPDNFTRSIDEIIKKILQEPFDVPRFTLEFHENNIKRERRPKGQAKTHCSKCNALLEETRKGKQRYCKACHAEYMRETRPKYSELSELQRIKSNARAHANEYLRRGHLQKQPCKICGNENAEKHHEDYSKPLDITWLCRNCHLDYHKKIGIIPIPTADSNKPPRKKIPVLRLTFSCKPESIIPKPNSNV